MAKTTTLNNTEKQIVRYALVLLKEDLIEQLKASIALGEQEDAANFNEIYKATLKLEKKLEPKE